MAKTDTMAAIAAIAIQVQTVGQARAVLGKATELLANGYARLGDLPGDVAEAAQDLLDGSNAYAGGIYAMLPTADAAQGQQLAAAMAGRVGAALETSRKALRQVEEDADADYWDFLGALQEVLQAVGGAAGDAVQGVVNAAAAGAGAFIKNSWGALILIGALALLVLGPGTVLAFFRGIA